MRADNWNKKHMHREPSELAWKILNPRNKDLVEGSEGF